MDLVENSGNVKTQKSRRGYRELPKRVGDMSKEALEETLRKKRACNVRALQIVERLLENTVSEDWFLDCLKYISESHFQDIIEERAISMNCGYPLCQKKLKNIPSQQFHISTKKNKVYDITERKNFCSNQCYKASSYLKTQLLTSPLWIRDKEKIPKFMILPVESMSGAVGEEIDIGQNNALKEDLKHLNKQETSNKFTSVSQFTGDFLSQLDIKKEERNKRKSTTEYCTYNEQREENKTEVKDECIEVMSDLIKNSSYELQSQNETRENIDTDTPEKTKDTCDPTDIQNFQNSREGYRRESSDKISENICEISNNSRDNNIHVRNVDNKVDKDKGNDTFSNFTKSVVAGVKKDDLKVDATCSNLQEPQNQLKPKKNRESKNKSVDIPPMTSNVIHIEKCLYEWFTIESMCFLFGEDKVKEMVEEKGECIKEYYKAVHNASWDPRTREQYIAICRRLNIMEIEDRKYDNQIATKPLPDYTAVREEARKMDLKVKSYYQGKTVYEDVYGTSISKMDNDDSVPVLPLVDLHAQKALRRRIVLDHLNRILPDLLRTFDLSSRDVSGDVRSLVTTFTLGANNITFKPPEWSLLGLIIIKMLSIKDTRLQILLESEQVTKYTTMMLMSFQEDGGYLNRLVAWLTDIDNLLHKH